MFFLVDIDLRSSNETANVIEVNFSDNARTNTQYKQYMLECSGGGGGGGGNVPAQLRGKSEIFKDRFVRIKGKSWELKEY